MVLDIIDGIDYIVSPSSCCWWEGSRKALLLGRFTDRLFYFLSNCTENTTVLIDGNPGGNDVFVSHSGSGMTKEDITLQCNITVPGSAVNITWFHNGEQNHSLSTDSIRFPTNSNVSAIAGTYVCAASTHNWEARVQFRILLKSKLTAVAFASYLLSYHYCITMRVMLLQPYAYSSSSIFYLKVA